MFKFQKQHVQKLHLFLTSVCVIEYNTVRKINLHFILGEEVFQTNYYFGALQRSKTRKALRKREGDFFYQNVGFVLNHRREKKNFSTVILEYKIKRKFISDLQT